MCFGRLSSFEWLVWVLDFRDHFGWIWRIKFDPIARLKWYWKVDANIKIKKSVDARGVYLHLIRLGDIGLNLSQLFRQFWVTGRQSIQSVRRQLRLPGIFMILFLNKGRHSYREENGYHLYLLCVVANNCFFVSSFADSLRQHRQANFCSQRRLFLWTAPASIASM